MKQAYAPNGLRIVGYLEKYLATYRVLGFDTNGTPLDDENTGAEICWDGGGDRLQLDGKDVYYDERGEHWTLDQCSFKKSRKKKP